MACGQVAGARSASGEAVAEAGEDLLGDTGGLLGVRPGAEDELVEPELPVGGQLAGDLVSDDPADAVATGFQRNTMTNMEGGTDPEEFRVAAVVDADGSVRNVIAIGAVDEELVRCVEERFLKIAFPPVDNGDYAKVSYPITFRAQAAPKKSDSNAYIQSKKSPGGDISSYGSQKKNKKAAGSIRQSGTD